MSELDYLEEGTYVFDGYNTIKVNYHILLTMIWLKDNFFYSKCLIEKETDDAFGLIVNKANVNNYEEYYNASCAIQACCDNNEILANQSIDSYFKFTKEDKAVYEDEVFRILSTFDSDS